MTRCDRIEQPLYREYFGAAGGISQSDHSGDPPFLRCQPKDRRKQDPGQELSGAVTPFRIQHIDQVIDAYQDLFNLLQNMFDFFINRIFLFFGKKAL